MRGRDYTVVALTAAVLLGAVWIAGSGDTVAAQRFQDLTLSVRDFEVCHHALFGEPRVTGRPDVFLLDECTGDTWVFDRGLLEWVSIPR